MVKSRNFASLLRALFCMSVLAISPRLQAQPGSPTAKPVSLRDCIEAALLNNRLLQIERINPEIARLTLSGGYGYYDPLFFSEVRAEESSDTGGFDPADFSRDAIYSAESEVAGGGLSGFLPSGMSYNLAANYAHSDGLRNGLNFDSYKLGSGICGPPAPFKKFLDRSGTHRHPH